MIPALLALSTAAALAATPPGGTVRIGPGAVKPLYRAQGEDPNTTNPVAAFQLQRHAVTNAEFRAFVQDDPRWRRDRIKPLFADAQYLSHWAGAVTLGPLAPPNAPVTRVSWFAARAYCRYLGMRLPTEAEWEYAAASGSSEDPAFTARILAWYGRPTPKVLPDVASSEPNVLGVYDLHGLIWEWVEDFGNAVVDGDSRSATDGDRTRFCGAGALTASDKSDYAAFMRLAFRSSLEGHYTIGNLGFRCAKDLP